jgi:hypothetical protein
MDRCMARTFPAWRRFLRYVHTDIARRRGIGAIVTPAFAVTPLRFARSERGIPVLESGVR